jgi:hypothetical protein
MESLFKKLDMLCIPAIPPCSRGGDDGLSTEQNLVHHLSLEKYWRPTLVECVVRWWIRERMKMNQLR